MAYNYSYFYGENFSECMEENLRNSNIEFSHKKDGSYNHLTCYVKSLSEFIQIIECMPERDNSERFGDDIIYRGTSNYGYDLTPSLCRLKRYHEYTERELVREFRTRRPDAFDRLASGFEQLAKMQHYGLPTRLLDFTTNPLVALYFACEKDEDIDGRVLCHCSEQENADSSTIDSICSFPMGEDAFYLESSYIDDLVDSKQIINFIYDIANAEESPIVAKPQYWNQRICNQSSVFMIFPPKIYDDWSADVHYYYQIKRAAENDTNQALKQFRAENLYTTEESQFYLNKERWEKLQKIYDIHNYSRDNFKYVKERFSLAKEIMPISVQAMEQRFISIIIPKEHKHQIMLHLSKLGITEAFIYPELEYTAKQIKSYYL